MNLACMIQGCRKGVFHHQHPARLQKDQFLELPRLGAAAKAKQDVFIHYAGLAIEQRDPVAASE